MNGTLSPTFSICFLINPNWSLRRSTNGSEALEIRVRATLLAKSSTGAMAANEPYLVAERKHLVTNRCQ